ncbi:MAG: GTP-binding protein [Proteobacteria bacterium]|nr:GTP-binding protein [Pseudomonadota bacterium]MDA1057973.1 GTP-binding protein [Pseudomonadota bacterium]
MSRYAGYLPVNVITGFLGSGKTTLLKRLLESPDMADTAVLINEFGEIGLDHHLLEQIDENIVMLQSGCLCCTIRDDLATSMRDLWERRAAGEFAFRRLVVETTGLADPAPIIYTLMADPVIRFHFRLGNIITTIDAVNGLKQMNRQSESVKQAAVADRIVLTKTDLSDADVPALRARLRDLNPAAPIFLATEELTATKLLTNDLYDPKSKSKEVGHWIDAEAFAAADHDHHRHDANRHDDHIHAFCLTFDQPIDWTAFGIWLTMLLQAHGEDVLRVKGLLNVKGMPAPVAIHGVQHVVHPPVHLKRWPDADRRSRIVFIVRDLERGPIEASLAAFNALAEGRSKAA